MRSRGPVRFALVLALLLLLPALRGSADSLDDMGRPLEFKPKKPAASPAQPAAEPKGKEEGAAKTELDRLAASLKLDDGQQAKLLPVLADRLTKLDALRKQLKDAEFDLNEQIRAVLTNDQKAEFDRQRVLAEAKAAVPDSK